MARRRGKAHNRKKGQRTESGQLSRAKSAKRAKEREARQWAEMTEREAKEIVIAQRVKSGLTEKQARDNNAATVQGRLFMRGAINQDQHIVADWYLQKRNNYLIARNSPAAHYERSEFGSSGDPDAHVEFCKSAVGRWNAIERVIVDAVFKKGNAQIVSALDLLLVRQRLQMEYVEALKDGLDALSDLHQGKKKKVAA